MCFTCAPCPRIALQLELDQAYDDLLHMEIWAGQPTGYYSASGFLTVWLSPTANFTATGTACIRNTAILGGTSAVVTCPPISKALYLTIERNDPFFPSPLIINELRLYKMGACPR